MDVLARAVAWLNAAANVLGRSVLSPIGMLPGWLSATLVSAITGVLLLIVFKYTSNQRAIKRVRDGIKADLLALKLFKESASVALQAQGRIMLNAGKLLLLSIVPMLVICICLLSVFCPDSFRSSGLRYKFKEPPPVPAESPENR